MKNKSLNKQTSEESLTRKVTYYCAQVHSNGSRGDMADSFAFATLFPNVVQPPVAVLSNVVFSLAVKCRLCARPVRRYDVSSSPAGGLYNRYWCEFLRQTYDYTESFFMFINKDFLITLEYITNLSTTYKVTEKSPNHFLFLYLYLYRYLYLYQGLGEMW